MNTSDIKYNNEIDSFEKLFSMARDQFVMYEKLEGIDNWDEYDFSIDCSSDQYRFKDMLQIRFIEELTEASVSLEEPEEHFWEEIGDSINFFLSAYTMLNIDLNSLESPTNYLNIFSNKHKPDSLKEFSTMAYPVIEKVGYLCNLLKNRPWAQSQFLVSLLDFDERLNELWSIFWNFLSELGLSSEDVFELFYCKYQINLHRISTGY